MFLSDRKGFPRDPPWKDLEARPHALPSCHLLLVDSTRHLPSIWFRDTIQDVTEAVWLTDHEVRRPCTDCHARSHRRPTRDGILNRRVPLDGVSEMSFVPEVHASLVAHLHDCWKVCKKLGRRDDGTVLCIV